MSWFKRKKEEPIPEMRFLGKRTYDEALKWHNEHIHKHERRLRAGMIGPMSESVVPLSWFSEYRGGFSECRVCHERIEVLPKPIWVRFNELDEMTSGYAWRWVESAADIRKEFMDW